MSSLHPNNSNLSPGRPRRPCLHSQCKHHHRFESQCFPLNRINILFHTHSEIVGSYLMLTQRQRFLWGKSIYLVYLNYATSHIHTNTMCIYVLNSSLMSLLSTESSPLHPALVIFTSVGKNRFYYESKTSNFKQCVDCRFPYMHFFPGKYPSSQPTLPNQGSLQSLVVMHSLSQVLVLS